MTDVFIEAIQKADVKIATKVFGDHPQDVLGAINTASEALGWIEEVFLTIEQESKPDAACNKVRIHRLAAMGKYVAFDMGNYVDCRHGEYQRNLLAAGAIERGEVQP